MGRVSVSVWRSLFTWEWLQENRLRVYCDGVLIAKAVEFDLDEGWVDYYATSEHGSPIMLIDEFDIRRVTGNIELKIERDE